MTNSFTGTANPETISDTSDVDLFDMAGGDDIVSWHALGGIDHLLGGAGTDTLVVDTSANSRSVYVIPGIGLAYLESKTSDNRAGFGGFEQFILTGGGGSDDLRGANGADQLYGGGGHDALWGDSTGNGSFHAADIIDGGKGRDTWHDFFNERTEGLRVDLRILSKATGGTLDDGTFVRNVEAAVLQMTQGNDTFFDLPRLAMDDQIEGLQGDDTATFTGGRDAFYGSYGDDTLIIKWSDTADPVTVTSSTSYVGTSYATANDRVLAHLVENYRAIGGSNDDHMTGAGGTDRFFGRDGNDTLTGNAGDDALVGGRGNDVLSAGTGNDILNGGQGDDTMTGSTGDDVYFVDSAGDVITELAGQGNDTVRASISLKLSGPAHAYIENLILTGYGNINGDGSAASNRIIGNAGDNRLRGAAGADVLNGGDGNDYLIGGAGTDVLNGGAGADELHGGQNADQFVFTKVSDSAGSTQDTILKWTAGDHIVLTKIDANTTAGHAGDDAFVFIGAGAHSGDGGTLRVYDDGIDTFVGGDTDGDGLDDFGIRVLGLINLTIDDFSL